MCGKELKDFTQSNLFFFFNFFLILAEKQGAKGKNGDSNPQSKPEPTWVEELFQGTFTNETRCLNCETVSMPYTLYLSVQFIACQGRTLRPEKKCSCVSGDPTHPTK